MLNLFLTSGGNCFASSLCNDFFRRFNAILSFPDRKEINVIRRTNYFRALNTNLFFTSSKIIIFLTFLVYILTGNHLTAEKVFKRICLLSLRRNLKSNTFCYVSKVFVTVSLFNNIRLIMTLFFPGAITMAAEARVSVKRIEVILMTRKCILFFESNCYCFNVTEFLVVG